jgi:hypothetical protein
MDSTFLLRFICPLFNRFLIGFFISLFITGGTQLSNRNEYKYTENISMLWKGVTLHRYTSATIFCNPIFDNLLCMNIQGHQVFGKHVPWYSAIHP